MDNRIIQNGQEDGDNVNMMKKQIQLNCSSLMWQLPNSNLSKESCNKIKNYTQKAVAIVHENTQKHKTPHPNEKIS